MGAKKKRKSKPAPQELIEEVKRLAMGEPIVRPKEEEKPKRPARFRWAVCRECGHRIHVKRHELLRASPPRCTACGGMVDLSEGGQEEYAEHREAAAEAAELRKRKQGLGP